MYKKLYLTQCFTIHMCTVTMDSYLNTPTKKRKAEEICATPPSKILKASSSQNSPGSRSFQESWQREYPFLRYDTKTKSMYCELCLKCQCNNSFTTGCNVLKKESITKHVKTKDHKTAADAAKLRVQMEMAKKTSVNKSEGAVKCALANTYYMAKSDLPSSMTESFNDFLLYQGVSQLADLKVDKHTNYQHHSSVADFQTCLSSVIEDDIIEKVKQSEQYSLMFDESTDISVNQNLIVYIRILETSVLGVVKPCTYFLGIDSLERANAESIYAKVLNMLSVKGIELSNLCSVSTDGAAVMVGSRSGVVTRLKQDVPGVIATHCIAHRLALSCCSGADAIPYMVKVQEVLNSIYKYFHLSPKNMAMLDRVQQLTPGHSTKFKEVFHTRWLSFEGSVDAFVRNFSSLVSVFLEEKSGKSLSLHKPITCYKFLYCIHFIADVLKPLSVLSKMYQESDLEFSEVTPKLQYTIRSLEKLSAEKSGSRLKEFLSSVPQVPESDNDGLCTFEFQGHTIRDSEKQRKEAVSICDQFVSGVVCSLNARFSDNEDGAVLTAMSNLFNPLVDVEAKSGDIETVVDYLNKIGYEGSVEEMQLFVGYAESLVQGNNKSIRSSKDVANLAIRKCLVYPATAVCARRFLVAPVSTVDCERGFSKQNLIKTCLRSRMSVESLDRLLRISVEGPEVSQFPYDKAFKKWAEMKTRRILC